MLGIKHLEITFPLVFGLFMSPQWFIFFYCTISVFSFLFVISYSFLSSRFDRYSFEIMYDEFIIILKIGQ